MTFSESIRALLDTYTNCISLLKAFGRAKDLGGEADTQYRQSRLRKSLRSNRSLVEQAYSSRLSESGGRFRRGDARAIEALDRILKRLTAAIGGLLRLSSKGDAPNLDYESLMSLSNASRADAIKAIDNLSRRLGSPSRSTVVSASSAKTPSKTSASRRRKPSSDDKGTTTSKQLKETRQQTSRSKTSSSSTKGDRADVKKQSSDAERLRRGQPRLSLPSPRLPDAQSQGRAPKSSGLSPKMLKTAEPNRISILSFSSDSTKLGEIPQKKWQSVMHFGATDPDGDEYNVRPTFPLKPYTVEVRERRFWSLFTRKRQG